MATQDISYFEQGYIDARYFTRIAGAEAQLDVSFASTTNLTLVLEGNISLSCNASVIATPAVSYPYWIADGNAYKTLNLDVDSSGYIYGITNSGFSKFDPLGNIQYQSRFATISNVSDIALDSSNNIFLVGNTGSGTADNVFVAKVDNNGNSLWQRTLTGNASDLDTGRAITVDSQGNAIVCGITNNARAFIAKYNSSGTLLWQVAPSTTSPYVSVAVGFNNTIYAVTAAGALHAWNNTGSFSFSKFNSNLVYDRVVTDSLGNVYVQGYENIQGAGNYDQIVIKFNSSGVVQWQKTIGTSSNEFGQGINVDEESNLYVTYHLGTKVGIVKFNTSGVVVWKRTLSKSTDMLPNDVKIVKGKMYLGSDYYTAVLPINGSTPGTYGAYTFAEDNSSVVNDATFTFTAPSYNIITTLLTSATASYSINSTSNIGSITAFTFTSYAIQLASNITSTVSISIDANRIPYGSINMVSTFTVVANVDPMGSLNIQWIHDGLVPAYSTSHRHQPTTSGTSLAIAPDAGYGNGNYYFYQLVPLSDAAIGNFQPGTKDWCLEFWFDVNSMSGWNYNKRIINSNGIKIDVNPSASYPMTATITSSVVGQGTITVSSSSTTGHIALIRSNGYIRLYVNGFLASNGSAQVASNYAVGNSTAIKVGTADGTQSQFIITPFTSTYTMFIDEFRWSIGSGRYSGNSFSVPTQQFRPDQYTQGLFHLDNNLSSDFGIVFGESDTNFSYFTLTAELTKLNIIPDGAALNSTTSLSAIPTKVQGTSAILNCNASLIASTGDIKHASASLSSNASTSAIITKIKQLDAQLSVDTIELTANGRLRPGSIDLASTFTMTCNGQGGTAKAEATLSSQFTVQTIISKKSGAKANLNVTSTLFGRLSGPVSGSANLNVVSTIICSPVNVYLDPEQIWVVPYEDRGWIIGQETNLWTIESEDRDYIIKE